MSVLGKIWSRLRVRLGRLLLAIAGVLRARGACLVRAYPSETSKARVRLAPFCGGDGIDLGFGGDAITARAIRMDQAQGYALTGPDETQLRGDATRLEWFQDGVLDFVYASHLLEDFEDTEAVLREWVRVLKPGGHLILLCPDEARFRAHCARTGQSPNPHHRHADFSLAKVLAIADRIGGLKSIHQADGVDIYSWELVLRKQV